MERDKNSVQKLILNKRWILLGAVILAALALLVIVTRSKTEQPEIVSLSELAAGISQGSVERIEDSIFSGEFTVYFQDGKTVKGMRDPNASLLEQLNLLGLTGEQLSKIQFETVRSAAPVTGSPAGMLIVMGLVAVPLSIAFVLSKKDRVGKKDFQQADIPILRFTDVAGLDENIQELRDIVSFLKEGNKFTEVGAKMPRGILMVGDPGTGKTLIAKAVAGEAGVPFFAMSGSEFVEVFVGVGASRVRSLFEKARKKAPCIIFIDEIDAVGRSRHRSESGAEMEQDQTLNQLLVEMDGFDSSEGVLVLAATNRVDVLDSALTRPGRFDRRVYIHRPDIKGREAILGIHVKDKRLSPEVTLANVARATPGLVGADLANIVNEAAIIAVRNGRTEIHMRDFEEAVEKNIAGGVARTNQVMSEDERKIIAYHEAGHAVVMHKTELSDPVFKITIIPRGQAGGYTMALPEQDQMLMSRLKILARITGLMGGRAAEEIFFQDITSGASNDLDVSTRLAEEMVMRLGMDRSSGLRVFPQYQGYAAFAAPRSSQKTIETIDDAVKNILEDCYNEARRILVEKRDAVVQLAEKLLEVETLNRDQFLELMEA
jgi:cell division protease FtsH